MGIKFASSLLRSISYDRRSCIMLAEKQRRGRDDNSVLLAQQQMVHYYEDGLVWKLCIWDCHRRGINLIDGAGRDQMNEEWNI